MLPLKSSFAAQRLVRAHTVCLMHCQLRILFPLEDPAKRGLALSFSSPLLEQSCPPVVRIHGVLFGMLPSLYLFLLGIAAHQSRHSRASQMGSKVSTWIL